jgi:hypothetical protein
LEEIMMLANLPLNTSDARTSSRSKEPIWWTFVLGLAGACLAISPAKAVPVLPSSMSFVDVRNTCPLGIDGCLNPGTSKSETIRLPDGTVVAQGDAMTSPVGPSATVKGFDRATGPSSLIAAAEIEWEAMVVQVAPVPPVVFQGVPVPCPRWYSRAYRFW